MYTTGEIAANICLEQPGLDILVRWKGFPTYASTQIIFSILTANFYYLEQNKYVQWSPTAKSEVMVPGQHETAMALPWGGTAHPVWFKNDPRVANVKAQGGVFARPVMEGVVQITAVVEDQIKKLPKAEQEKALSDMAASLLAGMPPRENLRENTSVDSVHASGPLGRAHCVIHGVCNYKQTGCCRPISPITCCRRRRSGSASRPAARPSAIANCSASYRPSAWSAHRN